MMLTEPNRHRISILLKLVASGSTFILAVLLSSHFNRLGPNISPGDLDRQLIVVAKMEIPVGSRIIAEQLTLTQFPRNVALEGVFRKIDNNLLGRVAVARIMPHEPIIESHLVPIGWGEGLYAVIPDGYRAMTVKFDDVIGVSGFIMPGMLVDVVVVIEPANNIAPRERVFKVVLQNVKVLASSQSIKNKNEKESDRVEVVTVQVTPDQAEKLVLASTEGKLQLIMRYSVDP
jgi:pilus assembly protein CpaB